MFGLIQRHGILCQEGNGARRAHLERLRVEGRVNGPEGQRSALEDLSVKAVGCILEGDEATSNAIASITLAEKLFQTGTTKLRSTCMTLPCARHTWHVLADDYMGMVRLIFKFLHLGIVPWDCKLDNVGLASPRREGEARARIGCSATWMGSEMK